MELDRHCRRCKRRLIMSEMGWVDHEKRDGKQAGLLGWISCGGSFASPLHEPDENFVELARLALDEALSRAETDYPEKGDG